MSPQLEPDMPHSSLIAIFPLDGPGFTLWYFVPLDCATFIQKLQALGETKFDYFFEKCSLMLSKNDSPKKIHY